MSPQDKKVKKINIGIRDKICFFFFLRRTFDLRVDCPVLVSTEHALPSFEEMKVFATTMWTLLYDMKKNTFRTLLFFLSESLHCRKLLSLRWILTPTRLNAIPRLYTRYKYTFYFDFNGNFYRYLSYCFFKFYFIEVLFWLVQILNSIELAFYLLSM